MNTPNTALAVAPQLDESGLAPLGLGLAESKAITPAQARVESVAAALDAAYKNASTLQLTGDEAKALAEDFPDEAFRLGAGGDANLIYIEHAYLRQRLNRVLGIGAAVPIRRREWAEEFPYFKDGRNKTGVRVYVDLALLVRGCLVGEAIGDAIYYPDNAKTNYSDALESAKSNAFRRCAKEFGVGLQAWMKGWGEEWKERQRAGSRQSRSEPQRAQTYHQENKTPPAANVEAKKATPATREWMLDELKEFSAFDLKEFAVQKGFIGEIDTIETWALDKVPTNRMGLRALILEIEVFIERNAPQEETTGELPEFAEAWWNNTITLPKRGSKRAEYLKNPDTIKSLYIAAKNGDNDARERLWGVVEHWEPKEWEGSDKKMRPPSQADVDCRAALDLFAEWHKSKDQTEFKDLVP